VQAPPALVAPTSLGGRLGALYTPGDLWLVCREPVPLAGMSFPHRVDWAALHGAGFGHVVCLTHDAPPYDPAPLTCTAFAMQDLLTRGPLDPVAEQELVARAAAVVVERWQDGEGVAVHCHGGRGRAGTVLGSALVILGHDPDVVIAHLDAVQRLRNRAGWPEHPWQAEMVRAVEPAR